VHIFESIVLITEFSLCPVSSLNSILRIGWKFNICYLKKDPSENAKRANSEGTGDAEMDNVNRTCMGVVVAALPIAAIPLVGLPLAATFVTCSALFKATHLLGRLLWT
jgi:hypothetical protein